MIRLLTILLLSVTAVNAQEIARIGYAVDVERIRDAVPVKDTAKFFFTATSKTCSGWTNIFGSFTTAGAVKSGTSDGMSISTVALANWPGIGGTNVNDVAGTTAGTFFTDCSGTENAVMRGYALTTATYDHSKIQLKISGLSTSKTYKIMVTGSSTVANRGTGIRVEGNSLQSEQTYNATNNTASGATFTAITPNGSGEIDVFVYRTGSNAGVISAIKIIEE